jgi:hypothetical protein
MNRITNALLVTLVVVGTSACYKEQPLEQLPPPPATRVIADLTDAGTLEMGKVIGDGALQVEGVVSTANDQAWTLEMVRVNHRDGRAIDWNHEAVTFPASLLTRPTMKVLDKKRSWMAGGAILAAAIIVSQVFDLTGSPDEEDQGEQPQQILIPVRGR